MLFFFFSIKSVFICLMCSLLMPIYLCVCVPQHNTYFDMEYQMMTIPVSLRVSILLQSFHSQTLVFFPARICRFLLAKGFEMGPSQFICRAGFYSLSMCRFLRSVALPVLPKVWVWMEQWVDRYWFLFPKHLWASTSSCLRIEMNSSHFIHRCCCCCCCWFLFLKQLFIGRFLPAQGFNFSTVISSIDDGFYFQAFLGV